MHYFKKIISCFVLFAIISPCVIVESKAADYISKSNFWTWSSQYTWELVDQLLGMVSDSVCTESEDEKHHTSSYEYDFGNGYYRCVCQHCGETFLAYESDISSAYDSYVDDLQTDLGTTTLIDGGVRIYHVFPGLFAPEDKLVASSGSGTIVFAANWKSDADVYFRSYNAAGVTSPTAPFACTYIYGIDYDVDNANLGNQYYKGSGTFNQGDKLFNQYNAVTFRSISSKDFASASASIYVDLLPYVGLAEITSNDITINSRPTSITGDYGIIGDDGSITKIDGNMIVDESSSTVYNPVTNTTHNYTDYAYDYSDRSYNLTLEDGSTMKVVYGDENVTIEEGDTVYNVYYLTSGSEDGSGGSGGAGDDGSGGIGGAISGLFDVLGEIIYGLIEGTINLATKALSALTGLLDLLKQFGESIVGFFGGYLDFLGAVFPFLPEETFTILNLGLILMIAAAVFKKFL